MSLEGKVGFVTGASMPKGIGRTAALSLARMGADLAISGFAIKKELGPVSILVNNAPPPFL
jgi:hypothetical protein